LLLLCAFLGHDLFMVQIASAQPAGNGVATLAQDLHADHGAHGDASSVMAHMGASPEMPPASHHVAGCESRDAIASLPGDYARPIRHLVLIAATVVDHPRHPGADARRDVPVPPPAVRRALLQVFLN